MYNNCIENNIIKITEKINQIIPVVNEHIKYDTNIGLSNEQVERIDQIPGIITSLDSIPNTYATKQELEDLVLEGGNVVFRQLLEGEIIEWDFNEPIISVTGVTLNKPTTTVNVNSTETLVATVVPAHATNKNVTWSSSNTSIATVSNGVVTGKANGNCIITATTVDGSFTATCTVTVQTQIISVTGVTLKPSSALNVGDTEQLTASIVPSNASNKNVTWSSSNTSIATVNNGLVTAITEGSATITVTTQDGNKTSTCDYTISSSYVPTLEKILIIDEINNTIEFDVNDMFILSNFTTQTNYGDTLPWWKLSAYNALYTMFDYANTISCSINGDNINTLSPFNSTNFVNTTPPAVTSIGTTFVIKHNLLSTAEEANVFKSTNNIRVKFPLSPSIGKLTISSLNVSNHSTRTSGVDVNFDYFKVQIDNYDDNFKSNHITQILCETMPVQPYNQNIYALTFNTVRLSTDGTYNYLEMLLQKGILSSNTLNGVKEFLDSNDITFYRKVA